MSKIMITLLIGVITLAAKAQHVNFDWMARLITARPSHTEMYSFKDVKPSNGKDVEFLYIDGSRENSKRIIQTLKWTKKLKFLTITSMSRLHQDSIMNNLARLNHLEALELVQAHTILDNISKLHRLKWLIFNEGGIETVPMSIYKLKRLEFLSFGKAYSELNRGNRVSELPKGISKLKRLQYVFLERNPIRSISDEFCKMQNLKKILVSDIESTQLPECLIGKVE